MSFKNCFFLARKSFFHKKINILNILLLVISMFSFIFLFSYYKSFATATIQSTHNLNFRTFYLLLSEEKVDLEKIKSIEGVAYITTQKAHSIYLITDNGESLKLQGVPSNFIKVKYGDSLDKYDVNDKVMICPNKFYLGNAPEEFDNDFLNHLYKGKDYLNKEIKLKENEQKVSYKIVGIYDDNDYTYGEYNICFTSFENVLELYELNQSEISDGRFADSYVIVLEDVKDVSSVQRKLESMGYYAKPVMVIYFNVVKYILVICIFLTVVIAFILFLLLYVIQKKFTQYNKKNNLIYKSMGYDRKTLLKMNDLESILLSVSSFLITLIIVIITYFILNKVFAAQVKTDSPIYISIFSIILSFFLSIFLSVFSSHYAFKKMNNSIMEEFEDCEI